ncbi:Predicted arabinose efflux permease, MFS family [Modestobacter sp. DSM 44400]|nr:Predicted arabinose efflux permease, MFS family [Modestobacter sp. DSM 44400]
MAAAASPRPAATERGFVRGSAGYRRASAAQAVAGAGTFVSLYSVQALLPLVAADFDVNPSTASLTLSVATGALALGLIPASAAARRWGLGRVVRMSLLATAVLGLLAPLAPSFGALLAVRTLQGLLMAGVPALGMAYLGREIHAGSLGSAMGLLVAGNTLGGLTGRVVTSTAADLGGDWRPAMTVAGVLSLACLAAFWLLLPRESGMSHRPAAPDSGSAWSHVRAHLRDSGLVRLFAISFLIMSAFITVYNYLAFRLLDAPFSLSQTVVGLLFLVYLAGTVASTLGGRLGDRIGRRHVLLGGTLLSLAAILMTVPDSLPAIGGGLILFTVGFFSAHTAASGWVSRRATSGRAQASSLYLLAYYAGSSVGGWASGFAFDAAGWEGVVAVVSGLMLLATGIAASLRGLPPAGAVPAG